MDKETVPLFVYSTLLTGGIHYGALDLKVRDEKTTDGELSGYALYAYDPEDAFIAPSKFDTVCGELVYLKQPEWGNVINMLDTYYTYGGDPEHKEEVYERRLVPVTSSGGEIITAWTYVGINSLAATYQTEANRIDSGDWNQYLMMEEMGDYSVDEMCYDEDDDWSIMGTNDSYVPKSSKDYKITAGATPSTRGLDAVSPYYMERAKKDDSYVWYIAYGSNMNVERFLQYMNIGRSKYKFTADDVESARVSIPHGVYYAKSGRWGTGGIAFLDADTFEDEPNTARAYRITVQQFWSLICQENGRKKFNVNWKTVAGQRLWNAPQSGLYSRVVNMGSIDGEVAVTMTNPSSYESQISALKEPMAWQFAQLGMLNPPSNEYLNIINEGAAQTLALNEKELKAFVPPKTYTTKSWSSSTGKGAKSSTSTTSTKKSSSSATTTKVSAKGSEVVFSGKK